MIFANTRAADRPAFDEEWAAELTMAAYLVALRHCVESRWLDLQLELWQALSATVARGGIEHASRCRTNEFGSPTDDFLAELAYVAYRIALPHGSRRSFLDLELELYQALRRTVECAETAELPTAGYAIV